MKFLLLTYTTPFLPKNGSEQRTAHLYKALSEKAHTDIVLINAQRRNALPIRSDSKIIEIQHTEPSPFFVRMLQKISKKLSTAALYLFYGHNLYTHTALSSTIQEICREGQYDIIISRYIYPAVHSGILKYHKNVFVDFDDHPLQAYYACNFKNKCKNIIYYLLFINYLTIMKVKFYTFQKQVQHIWLSNAKQCVRKNSSVLINIPIFGVNTLITKDKQKEFTVLFVGLLLHPPNKEGVDYFIKHVWTSLIKKNQHISLRIVGAGVDTDDKYNWELHHGVIVVGQVDILLEEYKKADITVAPLYSGSGTNIKLLESAALGIPCVASSFATRGYEWLHEQDFIHLCSDTDTSYAENIAYFIDNPNAIKEIGEKLQIIIKQQYTYDVFKKQLYDSLNNK